jgi:Tetratricopeptide repeat
MSRILEIIGNVAMYGFLLGFVGWLFWRSLRRSDQPERLIFKWVVTALIVWAIFKFIVPDFERGGYDAVFGLIVMLILGGIMAVMWRHSMIDMVANPIASLYDGGTEPPEPKPYYSIAHARRKRREFLEAVVAIREQLAKFPNDFEGVMLLASIQAEDLQDLASAEMTLNHFCEQPNPPPKQFAAAMNHLADWHIKLARDVGSARAALEKIIARFPDTDLSLQAAQRIAHLGGTEKQMRVSLDRQPKAVPEGVKNIGLLTSSEHLRPAEADPTKLAVAYVNHLEQHPHDTEAREELAIIYAEHYQRMDLATNELNQLIETPNQPAKRVTHWLNLLADLQIRHGADENAVRATLERIVEKFPDWAVAELARTRLAHLKLEFKGKKDTPEVKLGIYEQNIGLKSSLPRQL